MGHDDKWNRFTQTGKVSDYLSYADSRNQRETGAVASTRSGERKSDERTSHGDGFVRDHYW